eukprot:CAMPEP_0173402324 /NCGR_PEP_ID=MMETSP1356-20130122/53541_1 /TAXON_ID=77927 ORGANISM="Hemiselmis virescens, Strain PCC157" /NCGR_SAMPLE_ID=MMETSP1356 /ASSEMBLY_ACC=CAM_ASM_000847 /LENGTH=43 /DNA_ID= /DNA_START= /DNA_END= /DNA_ORIENTATION=
MSRSLDAICVAIFSAARIKSSGSVTMTSSPHSNAILLGILAAV